MPRNERLEQALEAPKSFSYGSDDKPDFIVKEAPWKPPAVITPDVRSSAVAQLQAMDDLIKPANKDVVEDWLIRLGQMVIRRKDETPADVLANVMAYSAVMNYPLGCFTLETVERASRRFKFFPPYAEVADFMDREKTAFSERVRRLKVVAEAKDKDTPKKAHKPAVREKRYWEMTEEERQTFDARIARIMKGGQGAQASTLASEIVRGAGGMPGVERSFDRRSGAMRGRSDDITDDDLEERKAKLLAEMAAAGFES